jgi:hypothetical protein
MVKKEELRLGDKVIAFEKEFTVHELRQDCIILINDDGVVDCQYSQVNFIETNKHKQSELIRFNHFYGGTALTSQEKLI